MFKTTTLFLLLTLGTPLLSLAGNMIETRDGRGHITQIYLQGNKARIEIPNNQGYAVMDLDRNTMHVVIHKDRIVIDMSRYMKDQSNSVSAQTGKYIDNYLKTKGLGPIIAGYETEEQEIYSDGQYCGSVFVSLRAMNELDLRRFTRALDSVSEQIQKNITGMTGMQINNQMDNCSQAEESLLESLLNIGFPLKSIDKHRRLESVITRLVRNSQLPANAFVIPKHYTQTNPDKMMQDAFQNSAPSSAPNMQEMMKRLSPEDQEMIRRKMSQMQQY